MVNFLRGKQSNTMSDVLRQHLAQSAAARLVGSLEQQQPRAEPVIPEPSLLTNLLPGIVTGKQT